MSLHKNNTLKEAVLSLSQKEKDKLLVRLINKDKMLLKQLHFQLLEDELDLEDRIKKLKGSLENLMSEAENSIKNIPTYSQYRALNILLRQASGSINEHEKVTKDKISEIECRLYLLKTAFEKFPKLFESTAVSSGLKLRNYAAGRIKNVNGKFDKLHEDLQFDLQNEMEFVAEFGMKHGLR